MKKVLFIYYFFPPIHGDWRGVGFVKSLPRHGWQPVVVSATKNASYGTDYSLLADIPHDIEVHRVEHRGGKSQLCQYVLSRLRIKYTYPDEYKGWYAPALQESRHILKGQKVDLIYSSSSPFTSALVAQKLKEEFGIPWVAEFRDPWLENDYINIVRDQQMIKPLREMQKRRIRKAERDILKAADRTVVVSWGHRQQLCELYGVEEDKIRVLNNGYDEPVFRELKARALYPDKLTIAFLGTAYSGYEEPAQRFLGLVNEIDKDAQVTFIGQGAAALQELSMENSTRILHLPKEKALAFASGSDFFLLITAPSARWHLPMKIYDYLRLGKPILAIVPEDGDAARIIREAKAGFVLDYEPGKMKEQLTDIFARYKRGELKDFHPDREYIAQFERQQLVKRLADVFDSVVPPR